MSNGFESSGKLIVSVFLGSVAFPAPGAMITLSYPESGEVVGIYQTDEMGQSPEIGRAHV